MSFRLKWLNPEIRSYLPSTLHTPTVKDPIQKSFESQQHKTKQKINKRK